MWKVLGCFHDKLHRALLARRSNLTPKNTVQITDDIRCAAKCRFKLWSHRCHTFILRQLSKSESHLLGTVWVRGPEPSLDCSNRRRSSQTTKRLAGYHSLRVSTRQVYFGPGRAILLHFRRHSVDKSRWSLRSQQDLLTDTAPRGHYRLFYYQKSLHDQPDEHKDVARAKHDWGCKLRCLVSAVSPLH